MAKTVTQNGVSFSTYKTSANEGMLPISAGIVVSGAEGVDSTYGGVINAVDIDWNSGKVSQATSKAVSTAITTTGELLGVIRGLADRITALENAMVTVSNGLVASLS